MSSKQLIWLAVVVVVGAIGYSVLFPTSQVGIKLGSVAIANEYRATSTKDYKGTVLTNLKVLKSESGTLGSVVITGAGAGTINLFDATSTKTNGEWATTSLASIPVSAAAGTYTFDVSFYKGLIVEIIGTAPTSTITYR